MLPNLIIVGVNKGGTTALFRYLSKHPDCCASSVKETCFFLPLRYGMALKRIEVYEKYFSHYKNEKLIIESTPGYFYGGGQIVDVMQEKLEGIKIVLVLRDPVTRFISFYNSMRATQKISSKVTLNDYFQRCAAIPLHEFHNEANNPWFGLQGGRYADYIDSWTRNFGTRLQITFFENLTTDTVNYLHHFSSFADIDPTPFEKMSFPQENKTRNFKNEEVHAAALKVYGYASPLLNRFTSLKKFTSRLYFGANEAPLISDSGEVRAVVSKLEAFYANPNAELDAKLNRLPEGVISQRLPEWLIKSQNENAV